MQAAKVELTEASRSILRPLYPPGTTMSLAQAWDEIAAAEVMGLAIRVAHDTGELEDAQRDALTKAGDADEAIRWSVAGAHLLAAQRKAIE